MIFSKLRTDFIYSRLIMLLAFALPLSTSALNIIAILLILLWLIEGDFARKYREIFANPVVMAIITYLMLYLIALLWTQDLSSGLEVFRKQWKYLLLPVLLTSVRRDQLQHYLGAFLAAMSLSVLASFMQWLDLYQAHVGSQANPTPFLDRIDYIPFLAITTFLLADAAAHRLKGRIRFAAITMALLMLFDIFINQGRTGQVAFFSMLIVWVFQFFPGRIFRAGLVSLVCVAVISLGAYQFSPNFRTRIIQTKRNFHDFEQKPYSSMGERLTFIRNSWELTASHPWLGVGPGDFFNEYRLINQRCSPTFRNTKDPHNQYLLVMASFGLAGLLFLARIFWQMACFRPSLPDDLGRLRTGFLVFFLTIMAGGSYLNHVHAGFMFILGITLLFNNYSTPIQATPPPNSSPTNNSAIHQDQTS